MLTVEKAGKKNIFSGRILEIEGLSAGATIIPIQPVQAAMNSQPPRRSGGKEGARVCHVKLVSPRLKSNIALRSTGTSLALEGMDPIVQALAGSQFIVDCTVEGLLHSPEKISTWARVNYRGKESEPVSSASSSSTSLLSIPSESSDCAKG
ncbi:hypothetical protein QWA_18347 [Alcaligenes faecalis subsp. faecalis NCIB 8687]|nr:hypothetical protein QWA_18347 [Alcaligenes faecalis subsp. faecalis NCIB 8687]